MKQKAKSGIRCLLLLLAAAVLFTACASKAEKAQAKVELGQKYLTEQNYTEAVASFTEAIGLDAENIPAYMGRAEAYAALEQYDDAKADYTTAIEKTAEQPYTQAEAYIGRAEVNETTTDNENALSDYKSASEALDKVDVEKITDLTEQALEALKIKVYNACARLSAFFGQNEAAAAEYTNTLNSLAKLPDDTDVLDVTENKINAYTGRADANSKLENYDAVLPDYDALIELGTDKTAERDALLAAMSLAKSKAGDLNASDSWLDEVNHADYAEDIQLTEAQNVLGQAAAAAQADGTKAYDKVKELLTTDAAKTAMQNLLARGYQLRYYDADGKMLAVYAGDTAWPDVNETENGTVTADALEAVAQPTAEEVSGVSLSKLYVYYGACEGRSREGEGVWFILNPVKTDLTAETYTWKNDKPENGFKQKEEPKPAAAPTQTAAPAASVPTTTYGASQALDAAGFPGWTSQATITYGGTKIRIQEAFYDSGTPSTTWDTTFVLSQPITAVTKHSYGITVTVPAGTTVSKADGYSIETFDGQFSKTLTIKAGKSYALNYAGMESFGLTFTAK